MQPTTLTDSEPIPRLCTDVLARNDSKTPAQSELSQVLASDASVVLLGDPGAGKTTSFTQAANLLSANYISVRQLLADSCVPAYHGQPLFIDGLDEARVARGERDDLTTERLVKAIRDSGCSRFCLSCREADWFGELDTGKLQRVETQSPLKVVSMDPLTLADVRLLVTRHPAIVDVSAFLNWAEHSGMNPLLTNPQTLELLCEVVAAKGEYPSSRKDTFEQATRLMIKETNLEHEAARSSSIIAVDAVLDAAGLMCTLLLIGNFEGFALRPSVEAPSYICIDNLAYESKSHLQAALRSRLFTRVATGLLVPRHREVAEYLAARYISNELSTGDLLIERLIALVVGADGGVINSQRGLVAWLAALCQQPSQLLERDPLGIILYGDVAQLSPQNRIQLLSQVQGELERNPRFWFSNTGSERLASLLNEDMAVELESLLKAPSRTPASQRLIIAILEALYQSPPLPFLLSALSCVVADNTFWLGVRSRALIVLQQSESSTAPDCPKCLTLLNGLIDGEIEDEDLALTGLLFGHLYPHHVGIDVIFSHLLAVTNDKPVVGDYQSFWQHDLIENTTAELWPQVMEYLLENRTSLHDVLGTDSQFEMELGALINALNHCPDDISAPQLFDWFGLGLDEYDSRYYARSAEIRDIQTWIKDHVAHYRMMIEHAISMGCQASDPAAFFNQLQSRFFWMQNEIDNGLWCLRMIPRARCVEGEKYLLQNAVDHLSRGENTTLTLEDVFGCVSGNPRHRELLSNMLRCEVSEHHYEHRKRLLLKDQSLAGKLEAWRDAVKSATVSLLEGLPPRDVLEFIGRVYEGYYSDFQGDTGVDRLRVFCNDESTLAAMRVGLRRAIEHPKIPSAPEIIDSYAQGKYYPLTVAVLGGVLDTEVENVGAALQLQESERRMVVTLLLTLPRLRFGPLLDSFITHQPTLVASIAKDIIVKGTWAERENCSLVEFFGQTRGKILADMIAVDLVTQIPARLRVAQLPRVRQLLGVAMQSSQHSELVKAIQQRVEKARLTVSERVCWLVAGALCEPSEFLPALEVFLTDGATRMKTVADEVLQFQNAEVFFQQMDSASLSWWIIRLGKCWPYKPWNSTNDLYDSSDRTSDYLAKLIQMLAGMSDSNTADEICRLRQHSELTCWSSHLEAAAFDQAQVQRELGYQIPNIASIEGTLVNRSPANAADLQAIVMAHLKRIADLIRDGSTNDFRQYWNEKSTQKLTTPKHEDSCRDSLLSDLKQALIPFGIEPVKEGYYVNDKRADIKVPYGELSISLPIEIKRNMHAAVWKALENQLIAQYTRDPDSYGYGIYLCFWFGNDTKKKTPLIDGWRPTSAAEFHDKLVSTIPDTHRHKIRVLVVDVSNPVI